MGIRLMQSEVYVRVRTARDRRARRLSLPLTVGASGLADIIVNSSAVAPCAVVVEAQGGALRFVDPHLGSLVDAGRLARYGVQIVGPIAGHARAPGPLQKIAEGLAEERAWIARRPPIMRGLLGGALRQKLRLTVWVVAALATVVWLAKPPQALPPPADLSVKEIKLTPGSIQTSRIAASDHYPQFRRGFTMGFLGAEPLVVGEAALLRFVAAGLDQRAELTLAVNGRRVYQSAADPSCLDVGCPVQVVVPAGVIKAGKNLLVGTHEPASSAWLIRDVLLVPLSDLTPERRAAAEAEYLRAQRFYDERGIVHDNLVQARAELQRLDRLLVGAKGVDELRTRATTLHDEVSRALAQLEADLEFRTSQAMQLNRLNQVETHLKELLELHPDVTTPEHQELRRRIAALKELQP